MTTLQKTEIAPEPLEGGFVAGVSAAMQALESVISEIAPTNIPVLLVGESGTGKEMFANRLHRLSGSEQKPLVKISCATMTAASFSAGLGLNKNSVAKWAELI